MKRFFIVLVLFAVSGCITLPQWRDRLDPEEKTITFVDEHGKSKTDSYVAAHEWIAKNFNSANDVIQMQDKEAGTIIVKAAYQYSYKFDALTGQMLPVSMGYTLSVYIKDSKIKTEFLTGPISSGPGPAVNSFIPKDQMPALLAYYKKIHDDLIDSLNAKKDDF